ncbi:pyridoxal-phosphate dependent enzyme [Gordonia amarae]|uniref:Pyridoxal-phosphate dependent enzyme n=1 Tax=Gordonia amarae TaxID=36821 RepID=A0A857KXP1_9ACTN|nr:pyridoxal-phosphate dependent enzyme [Gordonia amarae]QHN22046.1 pyridoxal-phosphate dependent enzyme [Gordonia amarae]QHN30927.1 pyridoxal-phosphate dependent enzyme [Gordonia amarae]QHN39673.1 pyridoxal-phosphate dependent enzyme [Gordonia amarae]
MPEVGVSESYLVDRSGHRYALTDRRWRGDDLSPLAVSPLPGLRPADLDTSERSLWRYARTLPVSVAHRVSLGEGLTPMPAIDWQGIQVHTKLEWFNPTGSFKDRGVSVMLTHLRSQGTTRVLEDSSGNGGAAVAAYSAAAGIDAVILVPAATSPAKTTQVRAYGATIDLVTGSRDDVADEAIRRSAEIPYASHSWHPMFLQGVKTIGYEIWESLGFTAPDNIVSVAGAGSIVLGCDLAFTELLAAGSIDRRPRLFAGQPQDWATIVDALDGINTQRTERIPTIAEGASIARPIRLPEVVEAIQRSAGGGIRVSDDEIHSAMVTLARRGLYAEPTSAVAAAALDRLLDAGTITADQTTVIVLTGTGLKAEAHWRNAAQHSRSPSVLG